MPIDILMPALSPTMTEGNLIKWLKKEGDKLKPGEVIAEIETDKATMEVEAVDEGILGKILIAAGTKAVKVNEPIAILLEEDEKPEILKDYKPKSLAKTPAPTPISTAEAVVQKPLPVETPQAPVVSNNNTYNTRIKATPLAKRVASIENISLNSISGTGPHGRIVKDDVLQALQTGSRNAVRRNSNLIRKVEAPYIRQIIAKRLVESKQSIPHFYLSIDCHMDSLLAVREDINHHAAHHEQNYKLSVNDFVIKAVAMALKEVPEANSSWNDGYIDYYNNVDVSVAVAIDAGLITPIVTNADQKSIMQISSEMKDLIKRARENKLKPEEFQGGGFSISNLGMYGIKSFSAIINPPQSAILAVGQTTKQAVVDHNDEIKIASIMNVTLSCDHRIVDGSVGANFLKSFKHYIEKPATLLI